MSAWTELGRLCDHGTATSCRNCEADAEIAALRAEVERLTRELDSERQEAKKDVALSVEVEGSLRAERDEARALLWRWLKPSHGLGASHPHFSAYYSHPAELWKETMALAAALAGEEKKK